VSAATFDARYAAALAAYVARRDEEALAEAYAIGRAALTERVGMLDVIAAHHAASRALAPRDEGATEPFLREALSPFEMALSGYREANDHLRALNGELTQQREAALNANRELESFSYSVSHDLRAPLRSIDGFSQALLEDYAERLDDEGKRYLRFVRESAQHMGRLVDGLLELSRVTRTELRREQVDLADLARRTIERLRARDPARQVDVAIGGPMIVRGDGRLLGAVLDNLLGNAWKFTSKRAHARIELGEREEKGERVFFVKDDGAGFDMAYGAKLFGAFQRLHGAREFEGTGIGLATVQRIVQRHGGRIWAEGAPDRGATFSFTLPPRAEEGS